jgi:hypothetical protein
MYLILKGKSQLIQRRFDAPGFAGSGPVKTYKSGPEINLFAAGLFK